MSGWVSEWVNGWVSGWVSEWVSEWGGGSRISARNVHQRTSPIGPEAPRILQTVSAACDLAAWVWRERLAFSSIDNVNLTRTKSPTAH